MTTYSTQGATSLTSDDPPIHCGSLLARHHFPDDAWGGNNQGAEGVAFLSQLRQIRCPSDSHAIALLYKCTNRSASYLCIQLFAG